MAKFLGTDGTTLILEKLISNAKKQVVLISPCLKISKPLKAIIKDAITQGVCFHIVYSKQELQKAEKEWLISEEKLKLYHFNNLQSKCYLNETHCIIGSINLYELSQVNNNEMSILISKQNDTQAYIDAVKEAERLIRISKSQKPKPVIDKPEPSPKLPPKPKPKTSPIKNSKTTNSNSIPQGEPESEYEKITTSKLASKHKITTKKLLDVLRHCEYISDDNGIDKITDKGKKVGAELKKSPQGYYLIWPADININKLVSN